jgi:hypothetical protein
LPQRDAPGYWAEIHVLAANGILAKSSEFVDRLSYEALDLAGADPRVLSADEFENFKQTRDEDRRNAAQ